MTPLVHVVCSRLVQLVVASAFVTALVIALLRPPAAVVVVVPAALPAPAAAMPIVNYVPYYCYGWAPRGSWRPYCGD